MDGSGAFVKVECGGGRFAPVEAARLAKSALTQAIAQIGIGGDGAQFAGEIRDVLGIGNQGGVANDFSERAAVGAKDRATAGHGFDGGHAEAFVERGINAGAGGLVERGQFGIGDKAEGVNVVAPGRLANRFVDRFGAIPIFANKDKLPGRAGDGFELLEGGNQAHVVFAGVFEARDVEKKWLIDFERLAHAFVDVTASRRETLMVEAVIDNANAVARDVEKAANVASGVAADGDDGVLPLGQVARDDAPVKHAKAVVFGGDVKGREIVDRADHGAGLGVHEPAITRDVQDVEPVLPGEARQARLVPEDIQFGPAKKFGNRNDLHSFGELVEQRKVVLENEENEFVRDVHAHEGAEEGEDILRDAGLTALNDRS